MKGVFFSGRNPKFPCSTVALSKVLLFKVHSSWWTLTTIFSTCKVDVSFLWIGAYVKLIDNSFGINNAVDILNNSPKIKLQWFHQKKLTMIGEQRQFASNSRPISRISGPLYNQPRFDWAFKEFVSCSAGEDEPLFTCHVCDGISSNEVQVDYALPNGFKWQVYCTDYYSMMVSLVANSLSQIHDGFTTLQNGRNCQYIAHLYGVSVHLFLYLFNLISIGHLCVLVPNLLICIAPSPYWL